MRGLMVYGALCDLICLFLQSYSCVNYRYPRGATLGGSAIVNAMAAVLSNDADWDKIAEIA